MLSIEAMLFICLISLAGLSTINCLVDESKPDLGVYHLRNVDAAQQTRERLIKPIKDYASGAIMMRQALFSSDTKVRCSAYAHLLKLIHSEILVGKKEMKQDTVIALAITVDNDRESYGRLFKMYQPVVLQETLKEAIEQLESRRITTPLMRDTWMELIDCAVQFELKLDSFLEMPTRAAKIDSYKKSHSTIGVSVEHEPRAGVFIEQEILEARLKVESADDEELKELRRVLGDLKDKTPEVEAPIPENDARDDKDAPAESNTEIEIQVPVIDESESEFDVVEPAKILGRIKLMNFLIRRVEILEATPKQRIKKDNKLTPESVADFVNVWTRLKELKLDPSSPLAKQVADFLNDNERSVPIYNRLRKFMDSTHRLAISISKMKKNWKSMEELEEAYEELLEAMGAVDYLIDFYDLVQATRKRYAEALKEFQTMNKFIEQEYW